MLADERKAVPFEPAGSGFRLYFSTADLAKLAERFERRDGDWVTELERRLATHDAGAIVAALRIGLRGPDGERPRGIDYRDLKFAPAQAARPLADAVSAAITGVPYGRLVAAREAARVAASAA